MNEYITRVINNLEKKYACEPEYLQAVKEVLFQLQEFANYEDYVKVIPFSSLNHSIGVKNLKNMIVDLFNAQF